MFKEYKLSKESFIGGWFISPKICNGLVSYFNEFNQHAVLGKWGKGKIKKSIKDSLDLTINLNNLDKEILNYKIELQKILTFKNIIKKVDLKNGILKDTTY